VRGHAARVSAICGSAVLTNGIEGDRAELESIQQALNDDKAVRRAISDDIARIQKKGFQAFEKVGDLHLVLEPFNMANGLLTQTLKIKRNVIAERYRAEIEEVYVGK
jgi:long-chain acyl-CoA synthetase